jgi:hypothetical protein
MNLLFIPKTNFHQPKKEKKREGYQQQFRPKKQDLNHLKAGEARRL